MIDLGHDQYGVRAARALHVEPEVAQLPHRLLRLQARQRVGPIAVAWGRGVEEVREGREEHSGLQRVGLADDQPLLVLVLAPEGRALLERLVTAVDRLGEVHLHIEAMLRVEEDTRHAHQVDQGASRQVQIHARLV